MGRLYQRQNNTEVLINGSDFWIGTHAQYESADPPVPKDVHLFFTDGEDESFKSKDITLNTTHKVNYARAIDIGDAFILKASIELTSNVSAWAEIAKIPNFSARNSSYISCSDGANVFTVYVSSIGSVSCSSTKQSGSVIYINAVLMK